MVQVRNLAFLCASALGARVKNTGVMDTQTALDLENQIEVGVEHEGSDCDSLWNPELDNYFKNKRVWGSGATACVFGGVDSTGTLVAIKVGKPSENIAGWRAECAEQQLLRLTACQKGTTTLKLHQEYAPICTKVDQTKDKKTNYYVMHAGGTIAFRDLPKHNLDAAQKKSIFAQLVTSIWALHSVGWAHNDLHGQNIVLDESYKLALIDFGSLKTLEDANINGYKRDSNAIWRWGAVLFGCGADAEWIPDLPNKIIPKSERKSRAAKFATCLQNNGADAGTIAAIKAMTDDCVGEARNQHVEEVYKTTFVQSNLKPASKVHFPWGDSEGCLAWDSSKFTNAKNKIEFGTHYKCETTPNWVRTRVKTRADGTKKTKKSEQCNSPDLHSACITTEKNVNAACGGGLNMRLPCANLPIGETGKNYDGACLKSTHPAYSVAQDYK